MEIQAVQRAPISEEENAQNHVWELFESTISTVVFYHAECYDGFTAAWMVRDGFIRVYGENWVRAHMTFIPVKYGQPGTRSLNDFHFDIKGKNVIIVDFSFIPDIMRLIIDVAETTFIHDHHESAIKSLQDLVKQTRDVRREDVYWDLRNDKSGALLAWEFYNGRTKNLKFAQYVDDRDRWQWKLPQSKQINAWIMSFDFNFDAWYMLADELNDDFSFSEALAEGRGILRKFLQDCTIISRNGMLRNRIITAGGQNYAAWVCNAPFIHASDISDLAKKEWSEVIVTWCVLADNTVQFSFRSSDTGPDVQAIAKAFGGGGHVHAAGCTYNPERTYENPEFLNFVHLITGM